MKNYKVPGFIAIGVFLTCMGAIFLTDLDKMNKIILLVSGFYAVICLGFLFFQLYAFVQAHTNYNEEIEEVKYQVFLAEDIPFKRDYES